MVKNKEEESDNVLKRCHLVVLGADDNPENVHDVNIPPNTTGAQLKTELELPLEMILRRQANGEVIANNDDVFTKVEEGDKLLVNPPVKVGEIGG